MKTGIMKLKIEKQTKQRKELVPCKDQYTDKSLVRLTEKKKEREKQITNNGNEIGEIITDPKDIKR